MQERAAAAQRRVWQSKVAKLAKEAKEAAEALDEAEADNKALRAQLEERG